MEEDKPQSRSPRVVPSSGLERGEGEGEDPLLGQLPLPIDLAEVGDDSTIPILWKCDINATTLRGKNSNIPLQGEGKDGQGRGEGTTLSSAPLKTLLSPSSSSSSSGGSAENKNDGRVLAEGDADDDKCKCIF